MLIFQNNYLARTAIEKELKKFAAYYDKPGKLLDIGCGSKPYKKFFQLIQYIGLDNDKNSKADYFNNAWELPFENNYFDVILLTQSLEHIEKPRKTVKEIFRVLKNGGVVFVSVPFVMGVHGDPVCFPYNSTFEFSKIGVGRGRDIKEWKYDFWRFTKFGLVILFKKFQIIKIKETNGYGITLFQLANYFFASLPAQILYLPIYFLNNLNAIVWEGLMKLFYYLFKKTRFRSGINFFERVYYSLPLNYILIV